MKTKKMTLTTSEIINAIDRDEMTVDEILECVDRTPMTRTEIWNAAVYLFDEGKTVSDIAAIVERYTDHYGITLTWDEKIGIHDDLIALEVEHEEV